MVVGTKFWVDISIGHRFHPEVDISYGMHFVTLRQAIRFQLDVDSQF